MADEEQLLLANRYILSSLLGSGGFAKVFLAKDTKLRREVAVKVLHVASKGGTVERFRREAAVVDRLRHPNILRIFDAELDDEPFFLVMELLHGEDLNEHMALGPLPIKNAKSIIIQMLSALDYLHSEGILHRDIKPANIFLEDERAVLMDFNLLLSEELTALTKTGMIVGTPQYMAPEIFYGAEASVQSEICSLGTVLYQILAPMDSRLEMKCLGPRQEPFASLAEHRREVPRQLDEIILRATACDPDCRYSSYKAMMAELEAVPDHVEDVDELDINTLETLAVVDEASNVTSRPNYFKLGLISFFVIVLSLAWAFTRSPKNYAVLNLQVTPRPGALDISWKSETPYPSLVELEGKNTKKVFGKPEVSSKEHHLLLRGLADDQSYSFQILFPGGKKSLSKRVRTMKLSVENMELRGNELSFQCPLAKEVSLIAEDRDGRRELVKASFKGKEWSSQLPKLKKNTRQLLIEVVPKGKEVEKRQFDGAGLLYEALNEKTRSIRELDVSKLVKRVRFLEEANPEAKSKRLQARGSAIGQVFVELGVWPAWDSIYQSAPLVFQTELFSNELKYRTFRAYVRALECSLYTFVKKAEPKFVYKKLPALGEFELTQIARPYNKQLVLYRHSESATYLGPRQIDLVRKINDTISVSCDIPDVTSLRYAEVLMFMGRMELYIIRVLVNDKYSFPIHGDPYIKPGSGNKEHYVRRIPLFALQDGENRLEFRAEQIFDGLSEKITKVKSIALNLY